MRRCERHAQQRMPRRAPGPDRPGRPCDTTREHGLLEGDFLPFAAVWPAVRDGYLDWLADYDATGGHFERAEAEGHHPAGRLAAASAGFDRVDRGADGQTLVIDYKTEGRQRTADRIKDAAEDTQLAFYAALLPDDSLRAAYLNVGERDGTKLYEQADVTRPARPPAGRHPEPTCNASPMAMRCPRWAKAAPATGAPRAACAGAISGQLRQPQAESDHEQGRV
jgi:hypothetical protein